MGLERYGASVLAFSMAACGPNARQAQPAAKEKSAATSAPLISADFGLAPQVLVPNHESSLRSVTAGPQGYLVTAELSGDIAYHQLRATVVPSSGEITTPKGRVLAEVMVPQVTAGQTRAIRAGDHWLVVYAGLAIPVSFAGVPGATVELPDLGGDVAGLSFDGARALVVSTANRGIFLEPSGQPSGDSFVLFPPDRWTEGLNNGVGDAVFDGTHHLIIAWTSYPGTVSVASIASAGPTGKVTTLFDQALMGTYAGAGRLVAGVNGALALYVGSPPGCPMARCSPPVQYFRTLSSDVDGTVTAGTEQSQWHDPGLDADFVGGNYLLSNGNSGQMLWLDASGMPTTGTPGSLNAASQVLQGTNYGIGLTPAADASGFLAYSGAFAARLTAAFEVLDDPALTPVAQLARQSTPLATFRGDHYLTLWNDAGRGGIHGARVERGGAVVDSVPIPIALGNVKDPFAASAGSSSFVGWFGADAIGAASVSPAGAVTPVDLTVFETPYASFASLATDGAGYVVTASISDPPGLRAGLFSAAGVFSTQRDFESLPARTAATFDGEHYVVVWTVEDSGTVELRAARFTSGLDPVDSQPRVLLQYPGTIAALLSIASNGDGSVLAWIQEDATVRAARLDREFEVLDPGGVVVEHGLASTCFGPALEWDGSSYWALWARTPASLYARQHSLVGRRYDASLAPLDDEAFVVTDEMARSFSCPERVGLVSDRQGELLLTYVQTDLVDYVPSVRARWLRSESGRGEGGEAGAAGGAAEGGSSGKAGGGAGGTATGGKGGRGGSVGRGGTSGRGGTGQGGTAGEGHGGTAAEAGTGTGGTSRGGTAGKGGTGGKAGAAGKGGVAGSGGSGGSGGGEGCGCRVPRPRGTDPIALALAMAGIGVLVGRRRVRR